MRRKIVKQGKDTLTVSIPREWARENKIEPNDDVEMIESGKKLIISTDKELIDKELKITINITKDQPFLRRHLTTYYKRGINEIKLNFENPSIVSKIDDETQNLLGFEIVEQTQTYCVIKNVSKILEKEFDPLLRRFFFVIQDMLNVIIDSIVKKNFDTLMAISKQEKTTNKLQHFCQRSLNIVGYSEKYKIPFLFFLLEQLEQLGDNLNEISKIILDKKKFPSDKTSKLISEFNNFFLMSVDAFYDFDFKKLTKIKFETYSLTKKLKNEIKQDSLIIHYLLSSIMVLHQIDLSYGQPIHIK